MATPVDTIVAEPRTLRQRALSAYYARAALAAAHEAEERERRRQEQGALLIDRALKVLGYGWLDKARGFFTANHTARLEIDGLVFRLSGSERYIELLRPECDDSDPDAWLVIESLADLGGLLAQYEEEVGS